MSPLPRTRTRPGCRPGPGPALPCPALPWTPFDLTRQARLGWLGWAAPVPFPRSGLYFLSTRSARSAPSVLLNPPFSPLTFSIKDASGTQQLPVSGALEPPSSPRAFLVLTRRNSNLGFPGPGLVRTTESNAPSTRRVTPPYSSSTRPAACDSTFRLLHAVTVVDRTQCFQTSQILG